MKKLLFIFLIHSLPLAAYNGFYVGGSLGGHLSEAVQKGNVTGRLSSGGGEISHPVDIQPEVFDIGASGMLYAGYGWCWRSLYLGIEGFVQFGSAKLHSSDQNFRASSLQIVNSTHDVESSIKCCQLGLDLLPGYIIGYGNTLLYARVGVGAARTQLKTDTVNRGDLGPPPVLSWNTPLSLSKHKNVATLRLGGGVEQRLSPRFSLRTDYIYTDYGRLAAHGSRIGVSSIPAIPSSTTADTNVHLYDHALLLGISYRFTCFEPFTPRFCNINCPYQGVYIGGALGGSVLTAHQQGSTFGFLSEFSDQTQGTYMPNQVYNNQFQGMFFLGYGKAWRRAYLGGELIVAVASHNALETKGQSLFDEQVNSVYFDAYDATVETSIAQYGFDVRPGLLITPLTLLCGRVGVSAANIKAHVDGHFQGLIPPVTWSNSQSLSHNQWKAALRLGLGFEHILSPRLHLRGDYVFTKYGTISLNETVSGTDSLGFVTRLNDNLESRLENHAVVLGLSYYFHRK